MPDLARIQSVIVHNPSQRFCVVPLFRIDGPPAAARRFLRWCAPRVPSGATGSGTGVKAPLFPSFSWKGLAHLCSSGIGLDPAQGLRELEPWFVEQRPDHPAVAPGMGFINDSAPEHWWGPGVRGGDIHIAVHAYFDSDGEARDGLVAIRAAASDAGLTELRLPRFPDGALGGARPEGGILHFGYRDGITMPDVDWAGTGARPVNFREFLLGYPNGDYPVAPVREGPWRELMRDGSFACIAWIHQDVAAFNRFLIQEGERFPGGPERLAAKMMGRWRDGPPVVTWPDLRPESWGSDNGFGYAGDPDGRRCPLNAHIRIVNPRDTELTYPNQRRFPQGPPRFIRRGFTYGPRLDGTVDDGQERGIVGTFFCARINEQFYTVLRWMQKTSFATGFEKKPHSTLMQDALFGNRGGADADDRLLPDGNAQNLAMSLRNFITYRGVTTLLMPSLPTLELLGRDE
ncbi:hypothetical protein ABNQ39_36785 (plasmid) [Azospirillum sp. A26]|uniref:Dyp-type peroxidase n=1 Tax=Azospirillum sp. A26 TaxID=3160607 RepID=UPI00366C5FA3